MDGRQLKRKQLWSLFSSCEIPNNFPKIPQVNKMFGGAEIKKLIHNLPELESQGDEDDHIKLIGKLENHFLAKKEKEDIIKW